MSFQQLKDSVSDIRGLSPNFAKLNTFDFPEEKLGSGTFSAAEACALLEQIIRTVELALDKEQRCIESISPGEMQQVASEFSLVAQNIRANEYHDIVSRVERLIELARPFAMLFTQKMDSKRYREISGLEDTMAQIRAKGASALRAYRKVKEAESRIAEIDSAISTNQRHSEECGSMHAQITTFLGDIQNMRDDATIQKEKIDEFSSLVQSKTDDYEEKLTAFSFSSASSNQEVKKLIADAKEALHLAKEALHLGAAVGLGAAFTAKEAKSGNRWVKFGWLLLGFSAAIAAIVLGWELSTRGFSYQDSAVTVISKVMGRALVMLVAFGIAGFAGKQFAKNKAIEEDYAYKAALLTSYPGFASKLGDENMQKQYTRHLLVEILQDPQRVRKAEEKKSFLGKEESSDS